MDKIKIRGGRSLRGTIEVGGAKNAALPILIASLLSSKPSRFKRVPQLADILTTQALLEHLGAEIHANNSGEMEISVPEVKSSEAPYDLVRKMRASVVVLGPLVARCGYARVSLPGGCAIGTRPINYHLSGLEKLGAEIELKEGYVVAHAPRTQAGGERRLIGARLRLDFPSVGATENLMMAATLAQGESTIENAAREPEIVDLAIALRSMGAKLEGEGTETITIQGVTELGGVQHEIMGDRVEAGTFLAAGLATRGEVRVNGIQSAQLEAVLSKFEETGAKIERGSNWISAFNPERAKACDILTAPFPGFPTDMQAQFMALLVVADGASVVTETIFENRYMHVPELARLGADITVKGNTAMVRGTTHLVGAPLMATDLRASASLIIAGLCAEGETIVNRIYHLDRGYEKMEQKLRKLGADIERVE